MNADPTVVHGNAFLWGDSCRKACQRGTLLLVSLSDFVLAQSVQHSEGPLSDADGGCLGTFKVELHI